MSTAVAEQQKPLTLAERKKNTESALQLKELAMQALCIDVPNISLVVAIANYKKEFKALQEVRKAFTGHVESLLITPFITQENKLAPEKYEPFKLLVKRELDLRIEDEKKVNDAAAKKQEGVKYLLHVETEFARVWNERRLECFKEINNAINVLKCGADEPLLRQSLKDILSKKKEYQKFNNVLLNDKEKMEIAKSIIPPDYNKLLEEMIEECSFVAMGVSSFEKAIETIATEAQETTFKATTAASMALASQPVLTSNTSVKTQRKIKIETTKEFARAVVVAFATTDKAWLMVDNKVKNWDKLSVAQMAAALEKCSDIEVAGVVYEEIKK